MASIEDFIGSSVKKTRPTPSRETIPHSFVIPRLLTMYPQSISALYKKFLTYRCACVKDGKAVAWLSFERFTSILLKYHRNRRQFNGRILYKTHGEKELYFQLRIA